MLVEMRCFGFAGRHHFLYDTEAVGFEQVPSLATVAPTVILRIVNCSF